MQLVWQTRKILGDAALRMNVTAVRVPVFYGHGEAVHLQTRRALGAAQARELLRKAPGVSVMDERVAGGYPPGATPGAESGPGFVRGNPGITAPDPGPYLWDFAGNGRQEGA